MGIIRSVDSGGFRATFTHTTRCMLDFSIPPLKIAIASPEESASTKERKDIGKGQTEVTDRISRDWLIGPSVIRCTYPVWGKSP